MNYYLFLDDNNSVVGTQQSVSEITDAGDAKILEIPVSPHVFSKARFLEAAVSGIATLGYDYESKFELPPNDNEYWDGSTWSAP